MSNEFQEAQGIRQGGDTSANAYITRSDPMLARISSHHDCYKIGTISIGTIMVADDLALCSSSVEGIQNLISEAESDAANQRYLFSESKTKLQNRTRGPMQQPVMLNGNASGAI